MGTYAFIADPKTKFPRSKEGFPSPEVGNSPKQLGLPIRP